MMPNRSMPASTVIPVLAYPDVSEAVAWLGAAFGFTCRLSIGDHRAQLNAGTARSWSRAADPPHVTLKRATRS
jgi:hypothetical protein